MRQFEQTRSLLVLVSKGILHQEQHFALSLVCILTQGGILEYRNLVMENLRFRISRFVTLSLLVLARFRCWMLTVLLDVREQHGINDCTRNMVAPFVI